MKIGSWNVQYIKEAIQTEWCCIFIKIKSNTGIDLGLGKKLRDVQQEREGRDGILRERREHARGRNLADCGRICGSPPML